MSQNLLLVATLALSSPSAPPAPPFTLPPGFVAEKVASPPLIEHPTMCGFDEKGRLFVADNAGKNQPAAELLKELPSVIRVLEDTNGDGKFDTSKVFADKLSFPMGALWHRGALYTMAAPSLWKFEDTNGDGVADRRTELITKFGFTGNAADVHGPWLGPDGRLYFTQGRHGHDVTLPDGRNLKGKAARLFRCKLDGSDFERVCGGGFDNPVEVAFTDEGEPFAVVNILHGSPARRDALIYCIDGGAWPYYQPVMGEFKRTGDLLPPVTDLGWVAPSGLTRYRGDAFGKEYQGNLFSTQFNTHKVVRHILERDGAHFKCRNEDFLVSTDPDFHPTCVREDADGSLIVVDTGGWFRIGCPTSQIAKPQVKGAIWRIRKQDAPKVDDPRGLKLTWKGEAPADLASRLADVRRFAVRDRARAALAELGPTAIPALLALIQSRASESTRRDALWVLAGIDDPRAREIRHKSLAVPEATLRQTAVRACGLLRDRDAAESLHSILIQDERAAIRREAAIALARIGDSRSVPALLKSLEISAGDRFLEHAILHALIEINNPEKLVPALKDRNRAVQRGALLVLDQMDAGGLALDQVRPFLDSEDADLQRTAWWIVSRRPAWAGELVQWLRQALRSDLTDARREQLRAVLVQFSRDAGVQQLLGEVTADQGAAAATRRLAMEVIAVAPGDKPPYFWQTSLRYALSSPDETILRQCLATLKGRGITIADPELAQLGNDERRPAGLRVAALGIVGPRLRDVPGPTFEFLRTQLKADRPPLERLAAAEAIGRLPLNDPQLVELVRLLPDAGPLELSHLVSAFERSRDPATGRKLLDALGRCKSLPGLSIERLRLALAHFPKEVQAAAEPLFKILSPDLEQQKSRLAQLEPLIGTGNVEQGKVVFYGQKAVCFACHKAQGRGGEIGPDLSKIAAIRTGRDLLEAIVFPSASLVRGYESFNIATRDGKVLSGLIVRETPDALFLVNADRTETRVPRSSIDEIEPARVSIMPQGIDGQLSPRELADLLAFLQSLK